MNEWLIFSLALSAEVVVCTTIVVLYTRYSDKKSTAYLNEKMIVLKQQTDANNEAGNRRLERFLREIGVMSAQVLERLPPDQQEDGQ